MSLSHYSNWAMKLSRSKLTALGQQAVSQLPNHMRAWQCLHFLEPDALDITEELHCTSTRRLPTISRPDHLLVKVDRASLNPIDLMNLYGYGSNSFYYARQFGSMLNLLGFSDQSGTMTVDDSLFPWTPGRDFVGTVVSCGPEAVDTQCGRRYRVLPGQRVVGVTWPFLSSAGAGGLAEYVVCPASYTAELPPGVQPEQGVAIGYSGLTAWSALVTGGLHPRLRATTKWDRASAPSVLVTGATGGVGLLVAQLAKLSGARVHVTCRSNKKAVDMMEQLEVDDIIVDPDLPPMNTRYDLIIDCIRRKEGNALLRSERVDELLRNALQNVAPLIDYLKPTSTARYVNLNSPLLLMIDRLGLIAGSGAGLLHMAAAPLTLTGAGWPIRLPTQLRWAFFQPSGSRLAQMLRWTAEGRLKLFVDSCVPFDRVPDAFARFRSGGIRGKILIHVSNEGHGQSPTSA